MSTTPGVVSVLRSDVAVVVIGVVTGPVMVLWLVVVPPWTVDAGDVGLEDGTPHPPIGSVGLGVLVVI